MFVELIIVFITLHIFYRIMKPAKPKNFPPGPKGWPIIGAAPLLDTLDPIPHMSLQKLGDIYGPVCGFRLGKRWAVAVNGYEAVKEVLTRDEFCERPYLFIFSALWGKRRMGIFFGHGESWKEQRRFTLRNLRDFGFGKSSLEGLVHEEVHDCIQFIKASVEKSKDSTIAIENLFGVPILNILWTIASGKRISRDDKEMMAVLEGIRNCFRSGKPNGDLVNEFHFMRHLPIVSNNFHQIQKGLVTVRETLNKEIAEHEKVRDPEFSRDFMDVYLKEIEEQTKNGVINSSFSKDQLVAVVSDLFNAGSESTSNSVAFAVLYMILNPDIQKKVQEELDIVVGKNRLPSIIDRPNLHYTEAVLTEAQRISTIAPIAPPRCNDKPATLFGYNIPKESFMMVNIHSVHMEKSYWGDPENFRPERFLDSNGKFVKSERMLAFGHGKRVCVGEPLAKMTYFSFFAAIMQNFHMEMVEEKGKPSTVPVTGFTLAPQPFDAKIVFRS